ncbi:serine hydrolase [Marinitenerispora sediminis]|uniref:Serine hydrolase n=1 Tax=Marinitenerispora sediminis TaxID=1931232 RepID=A0A368T628_9ACTN|nr:serine hydrolase [Marinitenerispora sediminis]RCV51720.1 serine hydrolase [Marinitenerispora sediminis]RCV55103.1 serine hydrolase [Marinitenerispora sediminis]RCV59082.1 serine hydrolase [Marinitenerispora sediminis]
MSAQALLRELREELDDAGLRGSFLVRDLHSGQELGIEPDLEFPIASLAKVPLAIATLDRIRRGELDGATRILVHPGALPARGPIGLSKFRHPAQIAIDDLLYLSTCMSDNAAADALFSLTPPAEVARALRAVGLHGITVRHTMSDLNNTPTARFAPEEAHLAHSLAIEAGTAGRGHRIPQLDVTHANSASGRACVELLRALWTPSPIHPEVSERVRALMADNVHRQRLAPDFTSDATTWSSKTGTMLNLRHEVGVVEHADGQVFAVAALTESRVPAISQPGAEALMGRVARSLRDHLRGM